MPERGDVPPKTVGVDLRAEGVAVTYLDGRETLYRGVPEPVTETVTVQPGADVHVLVTDPTETEGVMIYVNDLKTEDEILEDTGVGRVVLRAGDSEELFPGVTVRRRDDERTILTADPTVARGRVFVFVEDDWTDRRYEFVEADADGDATGDDTESTDDGLTGDDTESTDDGLTGDVTAGTGDSGESVVGGRGVDDRADETGWIEEPAVEDEPTADDQSEGEP